MGWGLPPHTQVPSVPGRGFPGLLREVVELVGQLLELLARDQFNGVGRGVHRRDKRRVFACVLEGVYEFGLHVPGKSFGCHHTAQGAIEEIQALLFEGRNIGGEGRTLLLCDAQNIQLTLKLRNFGNVKNSHRHVAAHHRSTRWRRTFEGDDVEGRPGKLLELDQHEVVIPAEAGHANRHAASFFLGSGDQLLQRVDATALGGDDHIRVVHDIGEVGEASPVVLRLAVNGPSHHAGQVEGAERVAVGLGRCKFRDADLATGTWHVLDNDAGSCAQVFFNEGDGSARHHIGAATGFKANNDGDRFVGIAGLRRCLRRYNGGRQTCCGGKGVKNSAMHDICLQFVNHGRRLSAVCFVQRFKRLHGTDCLPHNPSCPIKYFEKSINFMNHLDLRDLRYFEVIARTCNLGKAAELVHRSQPAMTTCIRRLEATLETPLFEKSGRGIRLTSAGVALVERARSLRLNADETVREIADIGAGVVGQVRIGVLPTLARFLMPPLCRALLEEAPQVQIHANIAQNDVLAKLLQTGEVDLILTTATPPSADLVVEPVLGDEVVVVASHDHPIFEVAAPRLKDLLTYRWVLAPPSVGTRQWIERVFQQQGLPCPKVQIETNQILMMPTLICGTQLLSFTSRLHVAQEPLRGELREVAMKATTMQRQFDLVHRLDGYLSPAAKRLVTILRRQGGSLSGSGLTWPI